MLAVIFISCEARARAGKHRAQNGNVHIIKIEPGCGMTIVLSSLRALRRLFLFSVSWLSPIHVGNLLENELGHWGHSYNWALTLIQTTFQFINTLDGMSQPIYFYSNSILNSEKLKGNSVQLIGRRFKRFKRIERNGMRTTDKIRSPRIQLIGTCFCYVLLVQTTF